MARQTVRDLIRRINEEKRTTIFLTSHDAGDIEKICRRVIVINHGRIAWDDTVKTMKHSFLRKKIIDLKLDAPLDLALDGVTVLKAKGYAAKLWALSATGFGLAGVFMGNASSLSRSISTADLDVYLLQPKGVLSNFLFSRMSISAWGDIAYGVVLFCFTQAVTPAHAVLFILFSVLMAMVLTALLAWIPVKLFKSFDLPSLLLLTGADAAIVAAAWGLFRLGLRVYESGSRIGARL